jgi:hypothetical protein
MVDGVLGEEVECADGGGWGIGILKVFLMSEVVSVGKNARLRFSIQIVHNSCPISIQSQIL